MSRDLGCQLVLVEERMLALKVPESALEISANKCSELP